MFEPDWSKAHRFARAISCLTIAFLAGWPGTVSADVMEEMIVTATKREQSLQEVPVAVSAYDSGRLRDSGVRDLRDLQTVSPSVVLTSSQAETAGTTARIRGVGTTGDNLGLESSVAVFIDGVYRNRNNVALTELGRIERIEVLRGPQGTLFGKNASAGLIHIITQGPDSEAFGGYLEAGFGEWESRNVSAGLTGPIAGEMLAISLDGSFMQRDEGFIEDIANLGTTYNDRDRYLVRAQLGGQLTDSFDYRLIADFADREESCCGAVTRIAGPTAAAIAAVGGSVIVPPDPSARQMTSNPNRGYDQDVDETGLSLEFNWDVPGGTITSITAYREWDSERSQDADYTNADIFYRPPGSYENNFETLTQELRFAGEAGDIDYLVGFYYVDEDLEFNDAVRGGTQFEAYANTLQAAANIAAGMNPLLGLLPPGSFVDGDGVMRDNWNQKAESWAFFTHNVWHVTDRFDVTVGLRYTDEEKTLNGTVLTNNPACLQIITAPPGSFGSIVSALTCNPFLNPTVDGVYADKISEDETTGTLNLSYAFTDDWLGYASYSRGFKAGGYNLDRAGLGNPILGGVPMATDLRFKSETADTYELGAKGTITDWMTANIAVFVSEFDDFQLNRFTGFAFIVENLEEAESKGVELELAASPADGLDLYGGVTYQDARYGTSVSNSSLAGKRLTNAPQWIATGAVKYEWDWTSDFRSWVNLDYRFNSEMNTGSDLDPLKRQASFAVWGLRLGFGDPDDRWSFEFWGKNIFERDYIQVAFDAPLQTGSINAFMGDPRTWGLTARMSF